MSRKYDEGLSHAYRPGLTREELRVHLSYAKLLISSTRSPTGWSHFNEKNDYHLQKAVAAFERQHPGLIVESCDVYWVGRHTNVPLAIGGVWWDYLFFNKDGILLGYYRRFLD